MNKKGLYPMSDDLKGVSLSEATMRPEDLIPCFLSALRIIESDNQVLLKSLTRMEQDIEKDGYYDSDDCQYDLDYLFDMLDACAPDNHYFGAHPGDGSDYGFWECEEF